jgi:uncharacterized protein YcfJ
MKKLSLLITYFVVGVWAGAAYAADELATITNVQPNYSTVYRNIPTTSCQDVEVPIYGRTRGQASTGDTVLGAVIGGALGNQVGGGSGKDAMTVLGAIVGADIANKRGRSNQVVTGYRVERQCVESVRREQVTEIDNYTIWYDWNGIQGRSYTYNKYNVGDRIPVSISINAN